MRSFFTIIFLCLCTISMVGQHTISGTVTNDLGEPLIQASIFLQGTSYATISDENGGYALTNVTDDTYTIKVSYVGYISHTAQISVSSNLTYNVNLGANTLSMNSIEINANRVKDNGVFAFTNMDREEIAKENLGTDVPFLLRWTPSAVVTSDAGAGIGYTGIRLRGSDATRINVTVNGVPINDSESHGVFWVNMPDFMSSASDVQIQRGVGTSTNGPGAFGGAISMNTNISHQNPYAKVDASIGSFDSRKLSVSLGTGILNDKYFVDGRYSVIKSDGYIDRATSDLSSYYFAAGRVDNRSSMKFVTFSGKERTYQSWYGSPAEKITGSDEDLQNFYDRNNFLFPTVADSLNLFDSDRRYNIYTYENQVDDYQQDHYQLHYNKLLGDDWKVNSTLFYTRGRGFFEEFKSGESYSDYPSINQAIAPGDTVTGGDLVRRRWLDNDFFGVNLGAEWAINDSTEMLIGGSVAQYQGDHFGNVISAQGITNLDSGLKYYEGLGEKLDANTYLKLSQKRGNLELFGDLQLRFVDYQISGIDDDLTPLDVSVDYLFFNPKAGISYTMEQQSNVYASFAVAHKEPNRGDFIAAVGGDMPLPERLYDFEFGYRTTAARFAFEWNNYIMLYSNQLVLTGELDQSGAFIRTNAGRSSRIGSEASITVQLSDKLFWNFNTTVSSNKIRGEFIEDLGDVTFTHENTDISYSPSIIAANAFIYKPIKDLEVELNTKYVSKQYLDNTQNDARSLPSYTFSNLRLAYDWNPPYIGSVNITAMVNNVFNTLYSSNGYTYSYFFDGVITENFVYPQAGRHIMVGASVEF